MAYMKKDLTGPHRKAAVIDRGLSALKKRIKSGNFPTAERRFPRDNPRPLPSGWKNDMHQLPNFIGNGGHMPPGWDEMNIGGPNHGGGPGRNDGMPHGPGRPYDFVPQGWNGGEGRPPNPGAPPWLRNDAPGGPEESNFQPGAPTGFPGMGDMRNQPAWQTQQPGFYDQEDEGPMPTMPAQHPNMPPGGLGDGPQEMNPQLLALIQQLMQGSGGGFMGGGFKPRPPRRWEGKMNPGFGRPQNFGVF